jgi:hypothetical protein
VARLLRFACARIAYLVARQLDEDVVQGWAANLHRFDRRFKAREQSRHELIAAVDAKLEPIGLGAGVYFEVLLDLRRQAFIVGD